MHTRVERDPLGEFAVPADAYYGIQTARALENFPSAASGSPVNS
jgi:fumarate hydratase, class II